MKAKIILHGIFGGIVASVLLGILAATLGSISAKGDPSDISGIYLFTMPLLFVPIAVPIGLVISFIVLRGSATVKNVLLVYVITFILICGIRYAYAGTIA
ncbi:MAG TPA: hypothetical protein VK983_01390 [Candidatus Limnocylindrales bacterium]|nr:hypothetical protein [Candidatus Limnocylindrales bacterium]